MKLVRVDGLLSQLDDFIVSCCIGGDFQPEQAIQYMSASSGNMSLVEENPYPPMLQALEELFELAGYEPVKEDNTPQARTIDQKSLEYVQQVKEKLEQLRDNKQQLQREVERLQERRNQYSHFTSLEMPLDEMEASEYIKIRFGFLPGESYERLQTAYADDTDFQLFHK